MRLQFNPEPIKLVDAAQRDVWIKQQGWRCDYTDGRGRCASRQTKARWNKAARRAEAYCERHMP